MYFSGRWQGYWEQTIWGRQPMHDLVLTFSAGGYIEGAGRDVIGRFTFRGVYAESTGVVGIIKQYLGGHTVEYRGQYDGEGTIYGQWSIGDAWSGPFALSPLRNAADADAPIRDLS